MAESVLKKTYFHINRQLAYSRSPLLTVGQTIRAGDGTNPFFGFYETYRRTYPVTLHDGTVVQTPAMTFLRQVRDGGVNPHNLPATAYEIAEHFVMLARELLWESIRLKEFPNAPSRQRGIWLLESESEVAHWNSRLNASASSPPSQVVELVATGCALRCDAAFLLGDSETLEESISKARMYWNGSISPERSEPEILFEGELRVVRIV